MGDWDMDLVIEELNEINEEILNNEGIATTQDLQKILDECYPNQNINSLIYLKFKLNDTN